MGIKGFVQFCIKRPVAVSMIFSLVVLFGFISLIFLKLDLFPDITFPMLAIITNYDGAGPEEIENIVTKPLEKAVSSVTGVKKVSSISSPNSSTVMVEFNYGTDMDFAALNVRERIDMVKGSFPDDVESPMVWKYDPSMMPVMFLGVSGGNSLSETTDFLDDRIIPRLERVSGVASVDSFGGLVREIRIAVDRDKLAAYNLPINNIEQSLIAENTNLSGGTTRSGETEFLVRTLGEFKTLDEIAAMPITLPSGGTIPLSEVAEVQDTFKEQDQFSRLRGKPSVIMFLRRESDSNTVQVARRVRAELQKLKEDYPDRFDYEIIFDQAEQIESSLKNVSDNAIVGALLAIIILWFFLRNLRSTTVIGISIPVSVIVTFAILYFSNMTLNIVSLGGLALGVGMLVDNSIVVLENIYRHRQEGKDRVAAAIDGASEVAMAITASTATTMVVFLPIVFVQGLTAQIFREMALTVCFSLLASLFVALTLLPMICSKFLDANVKENHTGDDEAEYMGKFGLAYRRFLNYSIHHRKTILLVAFAAFVLGFVPLVAGYIKMDFMPASRPGEFTVDFELATGTPIETTEKFAHRLEEFINQFPEVETISTFIGSSSNSRNSDSSEMGFLMVTIKDDQKDKTEGIMEKVRQFASTLTEAELKVKKQTRGGMSSGLPISIEIAGPDLNKLKELANEAVAIIKQIPGTREVRSDYEEGRPELQLRIDKKKANSYGLTTKTIASAVRTAYQGFVPTVFREGGDEYDIRVQLKEADRFRASDLSSIIIQAPNGALVPLSDVAEIVFTNGPSKINRENQTRTIKVTGDIFGRDLNSVTKDIEAALKEQMHFPTEYDFAITGEAEDMKESFSSLMLALVLAVIFVYMVMAIQYESLLHPFTIMLTMPLTIFGVTWSLWLTGRSLNVSALIGVIMLAGIVVNNAIVLVDYIETLRRYGMSRTEAVLHAGPTRLRPVLMTTLTTVLGMLPLALGIGDGAEMQAPLATVIIGGLSFSTLLTLIAIPVLYTVMDDFGVWLRRVFHKQPAEVSYHS